ncbi:MAG TPA: glycosyl hydrolase family 28 protein [Longimicrobiaceae bacterium]|nr:glycosyl hydrolase family 28 protein [Longimicrobiaceae bacterium]
MPRGRRDPAQRRHHARRRKLGAPPRRRCEQRDRRGPGLIDGQGIQFHSPERGATPPSGLGGSRRPYHMLFYRCDHLRVRSVRLLNSAFHSVRVIESRYVWMEGLHIHNRVNGNNDGFHFVSAEHLAVSNCTVESQDDACALFGSCRYVTITNSYFSTRWSVFRFGGGSPADVAISNCVLHQVFGCPITFQVTPGSVFENISFCDVHLTFGGGGTAAEGAVRDVPEVAGEYFMLGRMPAYALFARNARALTLHNVRFQVSQPDQRPAVILDHVVDAAISGMSVQGNPQAESVLRFIDTKEVLSTATRVLTLAATFLQLEGTGNGRVTIDGGDLSKAERTLAFADGATARAVPAR